MVMNLPSEVAQAYDRWHGQLGVDEDADAPWHQLVKRHLPPLEGCRVLENGCGRGGLARWLAEQHPALLVPADFSAVAVSKARDFSRDTASRFLVADITRLPHPDESFDIAISCETIEHVLDPSAAVRELARVLRPGGHLYLTTPNYLNLLGLYRMYCRLDGRRFREENQPVNNFTTLVRTFHWLRIAGLSPRLVDAAGHYVLLPGRPPIRLKRLERLSWLNWVARHPLIIASKSGAV
jgi:SAM-dependent methyltransferase